MKKLISIMFLSVLALVSVPVYAAESGVANKPMSILEFMSQPEQTGLGRRLVIRKYDEYRTTLAVLPKPSLEKQRIRLDEIRHRV